VYLVAFVLCIAVVVIIRVTRDVPDKEYAAESGVIPPDGMM